MEMLSVGGTEKFFHWLLSATREMLPCVQAGSWSGCYGLLWIAMAGLNVLVGGTLRINATMATNRNETVTNLFL